ncbi:alpha/beta fold hydrolase [Megalodesulfovibrio paquesii]
MRTGTVHTAAGESIVYVEHGQGEPLVLVSGWGGDYRGWEAELKYFGNSMRCLTLEHPGLPAGPLATPLPEEGCSTGALADRIAAGLRALGIGSANVLGMSMGGAIAQELALRHPELVRRLVLSGTFARLDPRAARALEAGTRLLAAGDTVAALQMIYWLVFGARFHREHLAELDALLLAGLEQPVPLEVFQYQAAACIRHDTVGRLADIGCQTLVTHGEDDILVPLEGARQLAAGIPGARLLAFAECGHCHLWEDPVRYRQAVQGFLAG